MEALLQFLNSVYPLSNECKDHLVKILRIKELTRKDFLLKEGQVSKEVCFIEKGLLRCFYIKDGIEVSRWFMREGDVIFSISSFYDQVSSFEYIQALEDCFLYYITWEELEYIYKTFLEFNYVGRELTKKYHKLWDRQLYYIQMQSAEERYRWLLNEHPELPLRVPAKHIASWLDITEVTFSKIKRKVTQGSSKKLSFFNSDQKNAS